MLCFVSNKAERNPCHEKDCCGDCGVVCVWCTFADAEGHCDGGKRDASAAAYGDERTLQSRACRAEPCCARRRDSLYGAHRRADGEAVGAWLSGDKPVQLLRGEPEQDFAGGGASGDVGDGGRAAARRGRRGYGVGAGVS